MRYRKLPVEIEAVQWTGENYNEIKLFAGQDNIGTNTNTIAFREGADTPVVDMYIKTLEGNMYMSKGDYIIKGVNGEFYPCKPDIFAKTYEEAKKVLEEQGYNKE